MKKKLFIYYQNLKPGGVAKVLCNLTWELAEKGHHVEVLFLMAPHEDFYPMHPNVKKHYVDSFANKYAQLGTKIKKKYSWIPKAYNIHAYLYDLGSYQVMNDWVKKNHHQYDTIITCWYKLSSMLSLNKKVSQKNIAWEHSSFRVGGFIYDKLLRNNYKKLKGIVCINKPSVKYYESLNKTFFIPNIADSIFEEQHFVPNNEKENIISVVGRLDKTKNVFELVKIFKDTIKPPDWKLQIIGDGPETSIIADYIKEHHLEDSVLLLGIKKPAEISDLLRKSKIFAFTSLSEAFGLALLEAMFCSNVIVAYDCEFGPSDIINEKNGFLIPLHNTKMFAEKLETLISNDETLSKLMKSSFEESGKWKKEKIIEQWKEVL
ncbi:glycosyltransferase [Chryseobacterium limigenitum]|uniref:Glycosyltransferase involved in cell wall bisynthesis n=1 Tax=Chryseobacterium limigenitum TaxID=1612149 RepID=A0A1K2IFT5_9FLAO|nr:glycosyltransferase [Chryseobacterium limigenitum]SFZ91142.1 Glycosyltransferase involved in cell wall bisynthesis [Chryseobacterium limigenitum]